MLSLDNVALRYGGVHAVDGVSLEARPGTRLALIGPNGAGKSSLLALLGGQARPSAGRIAFDGRDITRAKAFRRTGFGVARSFQIASLFPKLSVREQATFALQEANRFGLASRAGRATAQRTAQLLEEWELGPDTWDRFPAELSYGQQRCLELALALARRPRLLLLDEPNVGLTARENRALVERIKHLDDDMIVVLVAHDMDVVFGVADRVVVMHRGRIAADGPPAQVRVDPLVREIYFGAEDS